MLRKHLTQLKKGSTPTLLLALLRNGEMYGYEMAEALAKSRDGLLAISEGSLYPTLHRLESDGLVEAMWRAGQGPRPRRYYRLTSRGRAEAERSAEELRKFAQGLMQFVPESA